MIVYNLSCANKHSFEGWFSSADDFGHQVDSKLLSCPLCGNDKVSRVPHAPYVSTGSGQDASAEPAPRAKRLPQQYANLAAEALANLIDKVVETTEDVGSAFPEEARRIHYHETPERHIRGTASTREVEALRDEGIEVVALPIPAHRLGKTH